LFSFVFHCHSKWIPVRAGWQGRSKVLLCVFVYVSVCLSLYVCVYVSVYTVNVQLSLDETYADVNPVRTDSNMTSAFVYVAYINTFLCSVALLFSVFFSNFSFQNHFPVQLFFSSSLLSTPIFPHHFCLLVNHADYRGFFFLFSVFCFS